MVDNQAHNKITFYACPHACSFVSHLALEFVGADFDIKWINLFQQEQLTADYLAISPRGKVPLLVSENHRVAENVAILVWIAQQYPEANLLPDIKNPAFIDAISDLSWFSSGMHPFLSRVVVPHRFAKTETGVEEVRASAMESLGKEFARIDARMQNREWWGETFSALDFYPLWLWARSGESSFDQSSYPNYRRYVGRLLAVSAVSRVLGREREFMDCYANLGE